MIATDPTTGAQLVMPDTRDEYDQLKKRIGPKPNPCCEMGGPVDHWPSFGCTGPNEPGRRIFTHCTCAACF